MTLLHQDGLANLLVDPVDVVISDLPVGYYPDDENAKTFELCREEGHSFAHFLFIEQGMRYTKPGGYLFFLVPDAMFGTSDFAKVDKFIKKTVILRELLNCLKHCLSLNKHEKAS